MSSWVEGIQNFTIRHTESSEMKDVREKLKLMTHTGKMVATVGLVVSVAITFFSAIFWYSSTGGFATFFWFSTFVIGAIGTMLTYDIKVAAENGYQLADNPTNFWKLDHSYLVGDATIV